SVAASIERRRTARIKDVGVERERTGARRRERNAAVAGHGAVGGLARRRALHQHHRDEIADLVRTLAEIKRSVAGRGVEDRAVGRRGRGLWRWRQRGGEAGGLLGSAGGQREREGGAER